MHETPRRGYLLRGANYDRAPPRRLQCGDIAEQPSSRHALDKIFQGQADGVEELLDYVAPGEDRDSRCLFALQVRRHEKAVSVPRVCGRWSRYPASVSGAAIAYSSLRLRSLSRENDTSW